MSNISDIKILQVKKNIKKYNELKEAINKSFLMEKNIECEVKALEYQKARLEGCRLELEIQLRQLEEEAAGN